MPLVLEIYFGIGLKEGWDVLRVTDFSHDALDWQNEFHLKQKKESILKWFEGSGFILVHRIQPINDDTKTTELLTSSWLLNRKKTEGGVNQYEEFICSGFKYEHFNILYFRQNECPSSWWNDYCLRQNVYSKIYIVCLCSSLIDEWLDNLWESDNIRSRAYAEIWIFNCQDQMLA